MVTEISVYLPNIPGQFSRVLAALAAAQVSIRGFSVDRSGAISQLRLLFTDAIETTKAEKALVGNNYEPIRTELFLLSCPDAPGALLRISDVLAEHDINIDYGYPVLGQAEFGEVFFALKVEDGKAAFALQFLAAHGITDQDRVPSP